MAGFASALERITARLPRLNPPATRSPLPVMVGNGGDHKPAELVARHAQIWLDFKPLEQVAAANLALDAACRAIGRDPADLERGMALLPKQLADAPRYLDAGCSLFMLRTLGPEFDLSALPGWLAWRDEINAGLGRMTRTAS